MTTVTHTFRTHWNWTTFLLGASYQELLDNRSYQVFIVHLGPLSLSWGWGTY